MDNTIQELTRLIEKYTTKEACAREDVSTAYESGEYELAQEARVEADTLHTVIMDLEGVRAIAKEDLAEADDDRSRLCGD